MCFTPPHVTLHYTSVIVLLHASKWLIFIQHFQLKYLCGQNPEPEKDQFIVNWCSVLKNKQTDQTKKATKN